MNTTDNTREASRAQSDRDSQDAGEAQGDCDSQDVSDTQRACDSRDAGGARICDGRSSELAGARTCFVCGPDNPIGLHLVFRLEDGLCVSEFTPGPAHVGYPGVVHGGMIYSVLDDVMANLLYLNGARAYTASCSIRYRRPASVGEPLRLEGRQVDRRRNLVKMEGKATRVLDGKVVAVAAATFVILDETEFSDLRGATP